MRAAEVAFVDADIGQSNLGPPAAVTLGYPISPVDLSAVPPVAYYFVGSTGPIGRFLPLDNERGACLVGEVGRAAGRMIALTTAVERGKVRIVQFGDVYVTPDGGELGQVKWAW